MKKKYLLLFAVLGMGLVSCQDFLTKYPGNRITPDEFFRNEREINLYANSFYNKTANWAKDNVALGDNVTDIVAVVSVNKYLLDSYSPADMGGWGWGDLRNINYFMDKVEKSPVSDDVKNRYLAEARFWRAHFYFEKVLNFGDVPWYDRALDPFKDEEELYKPRDPRTAVMDHILEDLNAAVKSCVQKKDASGSCITKFVALAMKARVCLFEGTFRKYHKEMNLPDADKWLREAAAAAKELMDSNQYKLHKGKSEDMSYRELFTAMNIGGAKTVTDEVIWGAVYDESLKRYHELTWKYISSTYGNRWSLTNDFANTYLMRDGSRYTDRPDYDKTLFKDEVRDRDLRLKQTIVTKGNQRIRGAEPFKVLPEFSVTVTGYQIYKWALDDAKYDAVAWAPNMVPVFRYAEVLLDYAEAKAELGEMNAEVWDQTIKLLRERAGVNGKAPDSADEYLRKTFYPDVTDKWILEVRRERAIELVVENVRYTDLVRWKLGDNLNGKTRPWTGIYVPEVGKAQDLDGDGVNDVCFYRGDKKPEGMKDVELVRLYDENYKMSNYTLDASSHLIWGEHWERKWQERKYLRPIPRKVLVLNPALKQNPGWEE